MTHFSEFGSQSVPIDHLKQTIANLATGGRHIKGFWLDIANRPRWWHPAVPFASPNGRPIQGEGLQIKIRLFCAGVAKVVFYPIALQKLCHPLPKIGIWTVDRCKYDGKYIVCISMYFMKGSNMLHPKTL